MELRIRILKYSGDIVQTGYIASIAVSATLNGVAPFTKHPTKYIQGRHGRQGRQGLVLA